MFLVLSVFCLLAVLVRLDAVAFSEQRLNMSLSCSFMAALALALGTMNPEQPVSLSMDMVSFAYHDGGVPALALVEFDPERQQQGLLVPIHVRLGMGMLGLWLTMIAAFLVGLASFNHRGASKQRLMPAHWCVTLLGVLVFGAWLKITLSPFSESAFAQYLAEFDLAEIKSINYPDAPWAVSVPHRAIAFVSILFGLSLIFLKPLNLPLPAQPQFLSVTQRVLSIVILGWCIYVSTLPLGLSARWSALCCGLFVTVSYVDSRKTVRIWFSFGAALAALIHWTVL